MIKDQTKITYREIMQRKFHERGLTLKDYKPQEMLETILCDCITKQEDIPSIAEGLLLHFCSVKRVLSADRQMLENTKLLDDPEITKLKIISEACREIRLSRFSFPLDITDKQMLNDFLEADFLWEEEKENLDIMNMSILNDLKTIYHAPSEDAALEALDRVNEKWEDDYPNAFITVSVFTKIFSQSFFLGVGWSPFPSASSCLVSFNDSSYLPCINAILDRLTRLSELVLTAYSTSLASIYVS